jgi:uracil-DNA glycosylase
MTTEEKKQKLKELKQEMREDKSLPLRRGASQIVFGNGNPDADVYFLGDVPGFQEDKLGVPFIGQAGKFLESVMKVIGMKRKDVYLSYVIKYKPQEVRDPETTELAAFYPYCDREIEIVDPRVVVTLGRYAMNKFLPGVKISQVHGKAQKVEWRGKVLYIIPMFNPAAAFRTRVVAEQFKGDFHIIPTILKQAQEEFEEAERERKKPVQDALF